LGVVKYRDFRSFVMADIPGIIEGAHLGKGLGHRFLKHIERNAVLLLLIPADSANHRKEYDTLLNELKEFNDELGMKDRIVAISKSEMLDDELKAAIIKEMGDINVLFFSSVTEQGLDQLKDELFKAIEENAQH
jgi:GTP-binding protein